MGSCLVVCVLMFVYSSWHICKYFVWTRVCVFICFTFVLFVITSSCMWEGSLMHTVRELNTPDATSLNLSSLLYNFLNFLFTSTFSMFHSSATLLLEEIFFKFFDHHLTYFPALSCSLWVPAYSVDLVNIAIVTSIVDLEFVITSLHVLFSCWKFVSGTVIVGHSWTVSCKSGAYNVI